MRSKWLLVAALLTSTAGLLALLPASASALSTSPTISSFSPSQGTIGTTVTVKGTNLAGATTVKFGKTAATVVLDTNTEIEALVPSGATTRFIKVNTPGGLAISDTKFVVVTGPPLTGVVSVVSGANSTCALLSSGGVDCWGVGTAGELGDGDYYTTGNKGSAVAVPVLGVGGSGTLGGVASLVNGGANYCALLTSGGVDCWGSGGYGQLGDGVFYTTGNDGSAIPAPVLGVGGSGTLGGVASLVSDDNLRGVGYCALLTAGGVDCWGEGYGDGSSQSSAVPLEVLGVGGSGTLSGVMSLAGNGDGFCALLATGGVDCWGDGYLGNGIAEDSAVPVPVLGVGGSGTLGGVASLVSDGSGYCALLTSDGLDCWGYGYWGELGNGIFYGVDQGEESEVPVTVLGVGGSGTLGGVVSVVSGGQDLCAVLSSGGADCWGYGYWGQLGNGVAYGSIVPADGGSAVPVAVLGVGGSGTLGGVASLASDAQLYGQGYCALLTSGGIDCWGYGRQGELGDGINYRTGNESNAADGSAVPVAVLGVGGSGTLGRVTNLIGERQGFCTLLTSGGVECWGAGHHGQLGDGVFEGSAVPAAVVTAIN